MAMKYLERELRRGDERDKAFAAIIAGVRKARGKDIGLPQQASRLESKVSTEQFTLREKFTDAEREALIADGAVIYSLRGETILSQKEAQRLKGKPSFYYVVEAGDRLIALPSRQIEVAIYPDPEKFFVPQSFNKSVEEQEKLIAQDAQDLRQRLMNLPDISEIIPDEAAAFSEIFFQHQDATGELLFGQKYAVAQRLDWVSGRTKNPTNASGSLVANVGDANPGRGLDVGDWDRDGGRGVGAVRLVVPVENR